MPLLVALLHVLSLQWTGGLVRLKGPINQNFDFSDGRFEPFVLKRRYVDGTDNLLGILKHVSEGKSLSYAVIISFEFPNFSQNVLWITELSDFSLNVGYPVVEAQREPRKKAFAISQLMESGADRGTS